MLFQVLSSKKPGTHLEGSGLFVRFVGIFDIRILLVVVVEGRLFLLIFPAFFALGVLLRLHVFFVTFLVKNLETRLGISWNGR